MMIDYSVRTSSRSRHVRLSVTARDGVVIVVPQYFDLSKIPKIVVGKEKWIKRAVQKVQSSSIHQLSPLVLPEKIYFRSINTEYSVVVDYHTHQKNKLSVYDNIITLSLNSRNKNAGFILLKKWLQEKGKEILFPWLRQVSIAHELSYNSATVRFQRTRWGSCSVKKNINLNRLLVFLPSHLVEYLFIHELCHTVEMNHSKRYWELVEMHCPEYKLFDKELKNVSRSLERWVQ
ncbi:MAG: SprT family zinc-dependent metalloprotease [Bacteroidota bacterium]|nr:SprT family zinc-dependent metalloprotease [Bacteroidota bacterium]